MSPNPHPRRLLSHRVAACAAVALLLFGAAACSDDGPSDSAPTSTTGPAPPAGPAATPAPTLVAAVEALLGVEEEGDHAASYRFLTTASREQIGDEADWADLRSELPAITGFEVATGKKGTEVVATVSHEPGLDPFVGLSPATERQTWRGSRAGDGWLVDGAPTIVARFPADGGAAQVAKRWAEAVQDCDEDIARLGQALDELHGTSTGASELCGAEGTVAVGEVGRIESGPISAELVAQYTDAALEWARVVPVDAPVTPFSVVLAPIGDEWRVVAVSD